MLDIVERVAGALPRRARPPARVRRPTSTTSSPDRPFPTLDAYDELPAARERHRHGRARSRPRCAPRSPATTVAGDRHPHRVLRLGRRRARRGLPRAARRDVAIARARRADAGAGSRAGRDPHRRVRRARCSRRSSPTLAAAAGVAVRLRPGRRTGSSAATSPSPACSPAPTSPPRSRDEPDRATATCCPTSCCRTAASSTATTRRRPPAPGRGRRHRRRVARRARCAVASRARMTRCRPSSRSSAARTSASRRS